ncbi:MAG: alanine--tRNA ligase [Candidatus Makaraimicrobium thalassicum]|nr:MAG: alanine--tRNA ligase [Candidatus Omnitrophota bacterium]
MISGEIRKRFLDFFKDRGHTVVRSDLLVPKSDPTLLFTGAGMNQFKEQFMGKNITFKRAVSCQKCLRTADLENVGRTPQHHTFFEMLGNFSFGDYFKKEAIQWAWEFMTKEMGLPEERLWVSVYEEDEESYSIWLDSIKVPADRIVKLGPDDNFWPANAPAKGPNGPCGPCSEIFYDRGRDTGCGSRSCGPSCDCGRFVEVWNLVFTEFERKDDGALEPLPNRNIDTGMGLERIASLLQGVKTNFHTDIFRPIIEQIKKLLGDEAKTMPVEDFYLIADHLRAAAFAIGDGVSPSNERRGYVVRKLIRRAYLKGGCKGPFLYNLVPGVTGLTREVYPEIEEKREHISAIIEEEEKRFGDTLSAAAPVLDSMISGSAGTLEGGQIFKMVDTYGLPLDVIAQEAGKKGVSLDVQGFEHLMAERREQSRKGSDMSGDFIFQPDLFVRAPRPSYSEDLPLEAGLEFIIKKDELSDEIREGEYAEIIISPQSSRFYAEAGGQVGDAGSIAKEGGWMDVINTFEVSGRKVFGVRVKKGCFRKNDRVILNLDEDRKARTARNHTATHLLQAALRRVLGEQVKQSGSFVDDKRLRFDFTHMKKLSSRELAKVEEMVNGWIEEGISVTSRTKTLKEAEEEGALSFFGEKYGDTVRVVGIGDRSKELCGGTHVDNTADIEIIKIISESSVASGIRRIEALTGENAANWIRKTVAVFLHEFSAASHGTSDLELEKGIKSYADDITSGRIKIDRNVMHDFEVRIKPAFLKARELLKRTAKKRQKDKEAGVFNRAKEKMDGIAAHPAVFGGINLVSGILEGLEMPLLRKAAGYLEKKVGSAVILLGSSKGDKAYLVCAVTSDLTDRGIDAGEIIKGIAASIGGNGGGRAAFAQAGGGKPDGLPSAVEEAGHLIGRISA